MPARAFEVHSEPVGEGLRAAGHVRVDVVQVIHVPRYSKRLVHTERTESTQNITKKNCRETATCHRPSQL